MSNAQATALQSIYAALRYRDCPAAIAWLKSALGFEEHVVYPNDDGTIAHAQLQFGGNLIMLGSFPGGPSGTSLPELGDAFGAGIYIALDTPAEVDAAFERAKAAGAKIIRELTDTDYGSHEFSVKDPEGRGWSFGTYRPQAT
jgi:uncharacterized glyoxalase superfamily protein PhnB